MKKFFTPENLDLFFRVGLMLFQILRGKVAQDSVTLGNTAVTVDIRPKSEISQ